MVKTRSQEDDPVPQWFSRWEEAYEQRFSRWEKAYDQWISRLEDMAADLLCRSRKKENPEDQICNDEELTEIEAETKSSGIEDRAVENEANATMISAIDKDESIPQFQVPIANSEILKSSESGKVDLGLAKLEVGGDVERDKVMSDTETSCAHKVLVKMPSKEKRIKHLKGWKFKFKPTSKRSRLIDDKFSFVDATVLLNKEPQETMWDCVKKEFKETMAACGKTIVDRFKLVHAPPRPGVYGRPLQTRVWDSGGSLLECVDEKSFGDDRFREVVAIVKLTHKPWDNQVWEPGGVLIEHDKWTWLETCYNHGRLMRFRHWMSSMCWKETQDWLVSIWSKIQVFSDFDIASFIGLEICGFETKKLVLLLMKLANRVWACGELLASHVYHKWLEICYKQQGDSELLVIVLECVDAKGGVGKDKKLFHLSFRNHRVWDPGG